MAGVPATGGRSARRALLRDPAQLPAVEPFFVAHLIRAGTGHSTWMRLQDPHAGLIGLLLIVSTMQHIFQLTTYSQAIDNVKQTPAYRNRLKALEF